METPIPPPLTPATSTTAVPPPPPPARPAAFGIGLKLFAIAFLVLALWIALQCIDGVRRERASYRDQAEAEVAQTWGGEQTIAGPFLVVPFTYSVRTSREILNAHGVPTRTDEVKTAKASAYFLPAELQVLHHSRMGRVHTYIMRGNSEEICRRMQITDPVLLEAIPLTLEEIFIYELGGADDAAHKILL